MTTPLIVEEENLSVAWAVAFLRAMEPGVRGIAPLVVNVTGFRDGDPQEVPDIRECLDNTLMGLKRSLPNGAGRHLFTDAPETIEELFSDPGGTLERRGEPGRPEPGAIRVFLETSRTKEEQWI